MNAVNEILSRIPLDQLAGELGTDEATAEQAAREAVASLMGGMQSNAAGSRAGEASLAGALSQHSSSSFFTDSRIDLNQVDTADGEKIVSHVLGSSDAQPAALGGLLGSAQVQKLLKMLAPIVIGYLAGKVTNGGFGDILGGILGGGGSAEQSQQSSGGGGLGDILGQIFGGGGGGGATTSSAESVQQGDSPFNTPDAGGSTDKFPTEGFPTGSEQAQQEEKKEESGGGILGDVLGGLFGKK